jgi:hypothetical protein
MSSCTAVDDREVAHDAGAGGTEARRDEPLHLAPASGDVVRGGVLDPGVGALGR